MRMYDVIKKKRDGGRLDKAEIDFFINGYVSGAIPDEQAAAFAMAVFYEGMDAEETLNLTLAIAESGDKADLSRITGYKADKHSTGGVGDKTTLVVAPIVASAGVKVAKMSGRGLGHTGGTVDKLESVPGFRTSLSRKEFIETVQKAGCCVVGQSGDLAPADKKLYAVRDITATVDSLPLIASSIMGKKLAGGADGIVLDVKVGSGAFNKTYAQGLALAKAMTDIGRRAGKDVVAVLSNMDKPLGKTIGNALEVREAIETLRGGGDPEFRELCVELAASMLNLAGKGGLDECRQIASRKLEDGEALAAFRKMIAAQGGDVSYIDDPSKLVSGPERYEVRSPETGYIGGMDAEGYGRACLILGAGRERKEDRIDPGAGMTVNLKTGDFAHAGDVLCVLHSSDAGRFAAAAETVLSSLVFSETRPEPVPIVLGRVD